MAFKTKLVLELLRGEREPNEIAVENEIAPNQLRNWKTEILNSDQGSQFTGEEYITLVESNRVMISMDGKGRRADNISIERWFRMLKYEEIYLKDYDSPKETRSEIDKFICDYNFTQIHSALGTTPAYSNYPAQLYSMLTVTVPAILDRTA